MDPKRNPEEGPEERESQQPFESAGEEMESDFAGAWERTRQGLSSVRDQAIRGLETAREKLKENALQALNEQKEKAAGSLKRLSSAIHDTASRLNSEGDHGLAEYADVLATQVDKAAGYLEENGPGEVLQDVEDTVRKQIGLFIGGMFVTGLIVARFVRASPPGVSTRSTRQESAEPTLSCASPPAPKPSPTAIPPEASGRFGTGGLGPIET